MLARALPETPSWNWPLAWARGWPCATGKTSYLSSQHLREGGASLGLGRTLVDRHLASGGSCRPRGLREAGLHLSQIRGPADSTGLSDPKLVIYKVSMTEGELKSQDNTGVFFPNER